MTCLCERKLDLEADCAEFCPFEGSQDTLAVGTYHLNEENQSRFGRCITRTSARLLALP